MVADIFYPIFTLKITILACYVQKRILGSLPPPEHHLWPPGGLTAPPILPAGKNKQTMCPYFFWIIPCHMILIYGAHV